MRHALAATILLASLCFAPSTLAQDAPAHTHEILLRDLRVASGTLLRADAQAVEWIEPGGLRKTATAAEVLGVASALSPLRAAQSPLDVMGVTVGASGLIECADGQRFPGERLQAENDGESIAWRHPMFGRMSFSLDDVRRAAFDTPARERIERTPDTPRAKDLAWLANGDSIEGFLLALTDRVEMQTDGGDANVPIERVSGLALSSRPRITRGPRYWIDEGTVCSAATATSAGAGWTAITLATGQSIRLPISATRAMLMDAGVVTPLSALSEPAVSPVGNREILDGVRTLPASATPDWNAYDVELAGPLSATWTLPAGALRFSALVELPLATQPWGDCEILVLVDGEESWRHRLSPAEPSARIALTAAGRRLTVEVRPGAQGAVNDRPVLRRAIIILSEPEA